MAVCALLGMIGPYGLGSPLNPFTVWTATAGAAAALDALFGEDEKKKLSEAYKELTKIELNLIELDVNFSMKKQAEFIINSYKSWKEIKGYFSEVISKVKSNWDSKHEDNNKAYFG